MVATFFRRKVAKNMRKKPICVALCYKATASHSSGSPEFAPRSPNTTWPVTTSYLAMDDLAQEMSRDVTCRSTHVTTRMTRVYYVHAA